MPKARFKIKLTGLEIEFEGERDDVPRLSHAMRSRVGEMLALPAVVSELHGRQLIQHEDAARSDEGEGSERTQKRARKTAGKSTRGAAGAVQWTHDPSKWGNPRQGWNPLTKTIWLLYILKTENGVRELTVSQIAATFNRHFREFGLIRPSNVSRDLAKAKSQQPPLVQNDTATEPNAWFLTEAGLKRGEALVSEALGIQLESLKD
jgi:hypothetical protein